MSNPSIHLTAITAWARDENVTARDAILFLLEQGEQLKPTKLFTTLTCRFVPPFSFTECQDAVQAMLVNYEIELTSDRYVVRYEKGEKSWSK